MEAEVKEILRPILLTEETHRRLKKHSADVTKPMKDLAEEAINEYLDRKQTDIPS